MKQQQNDGINSEVLGKRNVADLAGGAVREACLIISSQVKISWTGTFVFPTRRKETQVAASPVCYLTLMLGYCKGSKTHNWS